MSGTTRVSRYQKGKTRKVKTNLDLLEQEIVSDSGTCWDICKSAPHPRQPRQHHTTVFYRPDALPAAQPTASKHSSTYLLAVPLPVSRTIFEILSFISQNLKRSHDPTTPRGGWSSQDYKTTNLIQPTCVQNLSTVASVIRELWLKTPKFKIAHVTANMSICRTVCHGKPNTSYGQPV